MASDLAGDNRKMESASNALPFISLCANTYWKSVCLSCKFTSLWRWMIAESEFSEKHNVAASCSFMPDNLWLGVIMLIPFTRRTAVYTLKASSENCVRAQRYISAISTNGIFSRAPILSTSGAERRCWELYQMCLSSSHQRDPGGRCRYRVTFSAWLPDINAISPPYYHGNISQSIRLNKWLFPWLPSLFCLCHLSPPFSPGLLPSSSLLLSR